MPGHAQPDATRTEEAVQAAAAFAARHFETDLDRLSRRASGRRSVTRTETRRGRYVAARPAEGRYDDIAFDATLRAAALRQAPIRPGKPIEIKLGDLHRKERVRKAGNLILFMVDASWSMATAERLAAAKGAVLSLLVDAYQRRDRVGLAVFRREGTEIVLPFTGSTALAERRLGDIAVGGKTPLSHALYTADRLFQQAMQRDPSALPLLVLLTDGAGNISLTGRAPLEEMRLLAAALRRRGVRSIVVDMYTRSRFYPTSPAAELAACLGGELCNMSELRAEGVVTKVRSAMGG